MYSALTFAFGRGSGPVLNCSVFFCVLRKEVKLTQKIGSLRYFYSSAYFFSAIWIIVAAIVPHALSRGIILRRIFTTLSYCIALRITITRQLPASIQMWYDTIALLKKIEVRFITCFIQGETEYTK